MTTEELDHLQRLADRASPGPWSAQGWEHGGYEYEDREEVTTQSDPSWPHVYFTAADADSTATHHVAVCENNGNGTTFHQDDANCAFIAACRAAIPELVALAREALELRMVLHDMSEDGFQRGKAGKYKRALERIAGLTTRPVEIEYGPGNSSSQIAREALREDDDG